MTGWISLTALATTIALAGPEGAVPVTELALHTHHHASLEECRLAGATAPRPAHVDPLTSPGLRKRCFERSRLPQPCLHVQASVIRDHDRSLVVDLENEPGFGPSPDAIQQQRGQDVESLRERGAILARWPAGSWHDLRLCLDGPPVTARRIDVPARCTLLLPEYAGKPHLARLERPNEQGCIVAVNPGPGTLAVDAFLLPPVQEEDAGRHFRHGRGERFPLCVAPGATARQQYALIGDWADAWHVELVLVHGPDTEDRCPADHGRAGR